MKNKLIGGCVALAALGALAAGTASAQEDNKRGFYLGAGLGQFNVEVDGLDGLDETISDFDSDDTSWKIFGGWRFNQYISVEAAYVNFGEPGDDFESEGASGDYSVELSGFAPYLVGTLPLGQSNFELFAKVGYYFYDVKVNADLDDLGGDVFSSDDSGEDFTWGAGVGATFMERLNVRLEYEKVDIDGTDDANAFWVSGSWRF